MFISLLIAIVDIVDIVDFITIFCVITIVVVVSLHFIMLLIRGSTVVAVDIPHFIPAFLLYIPIVSAFVIYFRK